MMNGQTFFMKLLMQLKNVPYLMKISLFFQQHILYTVSFSPSTAFPNPVNITVLVLHTPTQSFCAFSAATLAKRSWFLCVSSRSTRLALLSSIRTLYVFLANIDWHTHRADKVYWKVYLNLQAHVRTFSDAFFVFHCANSLHPKRFNLYKWIIPKRHPLDVFLRKSFTCLSSPAILFREKRTIAFHKTTAHLPYIVEFIHLLFTTFAFSHPFVSFQNIDTVYPAQV